MAEKTITSAPEYYRERAAEMLKLAEDAATDEARHAYLLLASNWNNLANKLENPSW